MPFTRASRQTGDAGFTLIELLVVISILGVLSAIAIFSVRSFRQRSTTAACTTDVRSDQLALDAYKTKYGSYADTDTHLTSGGVIKSLTDASGYTIGYTASNPYTDYTLTVKVGTAASQTLSATSTKAQIKTACATP